MTIAEFRNLLCGDMVRGVYELDGQSFIATRFSYPVGDSVNLYLVDEDGRQKVSDLGTTNYILRTKGIDPDTDERKRFIQSVCELYGLEVDEDFAFTKAIDEKTAGVDAIVFCEAITRISTLQYDPRPKHYSGLDVEVEEVLSASVPAGRLTRKWVARDVDPEGYYPVDYHVNSIGKPRDIFVVSTRLRAESAAGTINFLRASRMEHSSLSIVAPNISLPRRAERKLEKVSTVTFGVVGNETRIAEFALQQ
jgi:Domain of unknown function DUF1828